MQGHGDQGAREQSGQPAGPWGSPGQPGPSIPPGAMPGWGARAPHNPDPNAQQTQPDWPAQGGAGQPGNQPWGQPQPGGWPATGNQGWQQPAQPQQGAGAGWPPSTQPQGQPGWGAPADATWAAPGGSQPPPAGAWGQPGGAPPGPGGWSGQPGPAQGAGWGAPGANAPANQRPAVELPGQQPVSTPWSAKAGGSGMGRKHSIPLGIFIGAALVVALGAAGAVWAITRSGSDGASAESARMLPPSTLMYMTMTTDAASRQWVQLSQLLKRLGVDGDAREARDGSVRGEGLNWEEDIAPFLGGQASFAITGMSDGLPTVVAVLETADAQKAWERLTKALDKEAETKPVETSHRGVTIRTYTDDDFELSLARKDRYLLFSNSVAALKSTLDIEAGSGANLAANDRFKAARAAITGDVLFFTYMDLPELAKLGSDFDPTFGAQPVDDVLASAGLGKAGLALAASAETTGLKFQWQLVGVDSAKVKVKLPAAGGDSKLARRAPDSTLFYLYGNDLYNGLIKAVRGSYDQLRTDPNTADAVTEFQEMWDQLTKELGFDLDKDLFAHITGEYALALGPQDPPTEPWVLGMGGVKDTAAVGRSLNRLTDWARKQRYPVNQPRVGNTTVTEATIDGQGVSYALVDSDLLVGFGLDTVRRALESKGKLSDNPSFQEALKGLPGDRVMTGFVDLQKLISLANDNGLNDFIEIPGSKSLGYLSFAATQQDDRYGGVVFLRIRGE